jgi:hypothetical protein
VRPYRSAAKLERQRPGATARAQQHEQRDGG